MKFRPIQALLLWLAATVAPTAGAAAPELSGVASLSDGDGSCVLMASGGVKCWGFNGGLVPVDVPELTSGIVAISGGANPCAIRDSGTLFCPDLGDYVPAPGVQVASVSRGGFHACLLTSTGGVKCWG